MFIGLLFHVLFLEQILMYLYTGNSVDVPKYVGSIAPSTNLHFSQQTQILNERADKYLNLEELE